MKYAKIGVRMEKLWSAEVRKILLQDFYFRGILVNFILKVGFFFRVWLAIFGRFPKMASFPFISLSPPARPSPSRPPFAGLDLGRPATPRPATGHFCFASMPPSKPDQPHGLPLPVAAVVSLETSRRNRDVRPQALILAGPIPAKSDRTTHWAW